MIWYAQRIESNWMVYYCYHCVVYTSNCEPVVADLQSATA